MIGKKILFIRGGEVKMKLVIAEKEDLAREIVRALPGEKKKEKNYIECEDYIVCWASGHLLRHKIPDEIDEKYKEWKLEDLPIYFENWEKTEIESNKKYLLYNILKLLKDSRVDYVIHAGDSDQEGQYLIDEILEYAHNKKPVRRLFINDGSIEAVKKSLNRIEDNEKHINLGKAAEARSIADMIVGFNLSRFYSITNNVNLSLGRVQTPTLALVVNRDEEIKKHIKEKYYELYLKKEVSNCELKLKNSTSEKVMDKDEYSWIKNIENKKELLRINKKKYFKENPLPYDLSSLQVIANNLYEYSPQKTLDITQALRDKHKAITYNRSEIRYLSDEHYKEAPQLVEYISDKIGVSADFNFKDKPKCFNQKKLEGNPHYGIIPTMEEFDLNKLSYDEKQIYKLIAERYLIQFLEKIEVEKTDAEIEIQENVFKQSSTKIIDKGYTKYFDEQKEEEEKEEENNLSSLEEGKYEVLIADDDFDIVEKETKPRKHYTEATLLTDMKNIAKYVQNEEVKEILKQKDKGKVGINGSIGTSATQGPTIKSLFDKGYLKKQDKYVVATDLAKEFIRVLPKELTTADSTALWWSIQQEIAEGRAEIEDLTLSVLEDVKKIISSSENKKLPSNIVNQYQNRKKEKENFGTCPKCNKGIVLESQKGFFCNEYKNGCKFFLKKKMKVFNAKEIDITQTRAKTLIEGKSILVTKVPSKKGTEYDAYFKLSFNGDYVNLSFDKFKENKNKN